VAQLLENTARRLKDWQTRDNLIAVAVATNRGAGGMRQGVTITLYGKPGLAAWSRSAFHGLAQVLVQSTGTVGPITLKAQADGLKPAELAITAQSCTTRPSAP
jgi:hypothetical protein